MKARPERILLVQTIADLAVIRILVFTSHLSNIIEKIEFKSKFTIFNEILKKFQHFPLTRLNFVLNALYDPSLHLETSYYICFQKIIASR